jgi:hypothetical protein
MEKRVRNYKELVVVDHIYKKVDGEIKLVPVYEEVELGEPRPADVMPAEEIEVLPPLSYYAWVAVALVVFFILLLLVGPAALSWLSYKTNALAYEAEAMAISLGSLLLWSMAIALPIVAIVWAIVRTITKDRGEAMPEDDHGPRLHQHVGPAVFFVTFKDEDHD